MKDWSYVGPVVLVTRTGKTREFKSLVDAVETISESDLKYINDEPLDFIPEEEWKFYYRPGYAIFDELGMRVPAWKIVETFYNLPYEARLERRRYRRFSKYRPENFRNGSVPGVHKRRGGCRTRMNTTAEIRYNLGMEADYVDEYEEYGRAVMPRSTRVVPTAWNHRPHKGDGNGWKVHRGTQYRVKGASERP